MKFDAQIVLMKPIHNFVLMSHIRLYLIDEFVIFLNKLLDLLIKSDLFWPVIFQPSFSVGIQH